MPTVVEIRTKWERRRLEWRALGVRLDGDSVAAEILADLAALVNDDTLTLREASLLGGYSVDHLQRLVSQGTLRNVGRKGAPRIRRDDVPTKPGHGSVPLQPAASSDQLSARRRIVADAQAHKGA